MITLNDLTLVAGRFAEMVEELAKDYRPSPVAIFMNSEGELMIGVMSAIDFADDDWCLEPVDVQEAIDLITAPAS